MTEIIRRWFFRAFVLLLSIPLTVPSRALAETTSSTSTSTANGANTLINGLTITGAQAGFGSENQSIYDLIAGVIGIVLGFLGILIMLYLVWGGWIYATSGGEKEKLEKAKKMMSSAIIGAFIIGAAYVLTNYVLGAIEVAITTEASE